MPVNYLYDSAPPVGQVLPITEIEKRVQGVEFGWVYMPLPFALNHVNLWLIGNTHNATQALVDTGISSSKTKDIWSQLLDSGVKPVDLLITHYHPDHIGLAGWIAEQCGCRCLMSKQELEQARQAYSFSDEGFADGQADWFGRHGLDAERQEEVRRLGNTYTPIVSPLPEEVFLVAAGDRLELGGVSWHVMTGGGHAPEQICLYSESLNVLIAADQILPRITPNVSLSWYKAEGDPLAVFLESLDMFADLPDDVLVLPSHGLPFTGLHGRIASLREHHEERLELLVDALQIPQTATELLPMLFDRKLDKRQLMFAMGECLSHLKLLTNRGQIVEETRDGVIHFGLPGS